MKLILENWKRFLNENHTHIVGKGVNTCRNETRRDLESTLDEIIESEIEKLL